MSPPARLERASSAWPEWELRARGVSMKQYLLSIYQPDGPVPTPDILGKIKQDLEVLNREMKAAGAWVLTAGLHPPSTATVAKAQTGERLTTGRPVAGTEGDTGGV